jgi:hypothetical protein
MITAKFTLSHVRDLHTHRAASLQSSCALSCCFYALCAVLPNSCFNEDGGIYSQVKLTPKTCGLAQHFLIIAETMICFLWGSYLIESYSTFLGGSLVYTGLFSYKSEAEHLYS